MFSFRKKSRFFPFNDLLGFDYKRIDFESIFPTETYATLSVAVATCKQEVSTLFLLNDPQGEHDSAFNHLLSVKQAELQEVLQDQSPGMKVQAAWAKDAARADDFIPLHSTSLMSDVLDAVFQSHVQQRRPVLMNFERSALFSDKPSRLSALLARDTSFHINFLSLTGHHGQRAKRTAYQLLHTGRIAYVGFEIGDFGILARDKYAQPEEQVIALLARQGKQQMKVLLSDY